MPPPQRSNSKQPGRRPQKSQPPKVVHHHHRTVVVYKPVQRLRSRRKKPPSVNTMRLVVACVSLGLIAILVWGTGFQFHLPSASHSPAKPTKLPSVSIAGSIPCQLPTKEKNDACAKAKAYAKAKLTAKGQANQWGCLDTLWTHEDNWDAWSVNTKFADPEQQAIGIPQMIPKYHGHPFNLGEWQKQVDWGLDEYIVPRYKTPCAAWKFWQHPTLPPTDQNWY